MSAEREFSSQDTRRATAADWLQRLDDPNLPEAQMQSWLEWFGASDENRKAFEEMQTLYRRMRAIPVAHRAQLHELARNDVAPRQRTGAADRSHRALNRSTRWAMAATLAALAVGGASWWKLAGPGAMSESVVYVAPVDRHRTVQLNDGSALALAADAIVAVNYSSALRAVEIERGQTYFEVERDARRPFVVRAGDVRVTAVGTAFNVVREERAVIVTVTKGAVEVARMVDGHEANAPLLLSMGEKKMVALGGSEEIWTAPPDAPIAAGWKDGRVEFVRATLSEVLPLVNQHAPTPLVIDDPRVADLAYSGTILREHVDEWIASLPHIYPVRTVALENGTTTLVMEKGAR